MQVFRPGDHGSTFGGNPLAAAVAMAALDVLFDEHLIERAKKRGAELIAELRTIRSPLVADVRGRGLLIGIEIDSRVAEAKTVVMKLLERGILSKDTHGTVVRIAPPLNVDDASLEWAVGEIRKTLRSMEREAA
jgi:ornithine--oxo-acid transaminase